MINIEAPSVLASWWLINAPVQQIAEFCKTYGYEITIVNPNENAYVIRRTNI